jgi:hypothetical protein
MMCQSMHRLAYTAPFFAKQRLNQAPHIHHSSTGTSLDKTSYAVPRDWAPEDVMLCVPLKSGVQAPIVLVEKPS